MEFSEKKSIILNALVERGGLQHIINIASEVLNNPIFVYDLSRKILAKSYSRTEDQETWNQLFPDGHMTFNDLVEVENAGVYTQIFNSDKPVIGKFDFFPKRFLGCRIRDKNSVIGIVTLVENNPTHDDTLELLVILCKAVLYEMLYIDRTAAMQKTPYYSLFKDLIENNVTKTEMRERIASLKANFYDQMRLILIEYTSRSPGLSIYYIIESLDISLHSSYSIIYDDGILLLFDNSINHEFVISVINKFFLGISIQIGVSRVFNDITYLDDAYRQAKSAIRINKKLNNDSSLCFYDNIVLYHFFEIAGKECNPRDFYDPVIDILKKYDKENEACLADTLEKYLEFGRNIQRTADHMYMHKNTLYYRIHKIEELCSIFLTDEQVCFNLQFSFKLLRFIDKKC
ncbi:MAG: PucR family transcriptional regulator [Eubacteriaceae bacterium]